MKQFTLDNGINMNKDKGKEFKYGKMGLYIKDIGKRIWQINMED